MLNRNYNPCIFQLEQWQGNSYNLQVTSQLNGVHESIIDLQKSMELKGVEEDKGKNIEC